MKITELVQENDMASFFKNLQKNNPKFKNLRIHGDPEHDELRRQDAEARAKRLAQPAPEPKELSVEERHRLEQSLRHLEAEFDPSYQYSDDHSVWSKHHSLAQRINSIKRQLSETASAGATSAASIGTVVSPAISPGKARGKKSYTGGMSSGSGTKSPPQPKIKQPKNADGTAKNGLDIKGTSLFGGPANEAITIKRR
jgi:hypothetical protein